MEGSSDSTPLPAAKQEIFTLAGKTQKKLRRQSDAPHKASVSDEAGADKDKEQKVQTLQELGEAVYARVITLLENNVLSDHQLQNLVKQALSSVEIKSKQDMYKDYTDSQRLAMKITGMLIAELQNLLQDENVAGEEYANEYATLQNVLNDTSALRERVLTALHVLIADDAKPKQQHYAPRHPVPKHAQLRHWARQHKISIEIDIQKLLRSMLPEYKFELQHDSGMAEFCAGLAHACEMYLHKHIAELDMPDTQPSVEETDNNTDVRLPQGAIVTSKLDVLRLEAPQGNSRRPSTLKDFVTTQQKHHVPNNAHIVFTQRFKYNAPGHNTSKDHCMMHVAYDHASTRSVKPTTFSITIPSQIPDAFTAAFKYMMLKTAIFADCKMKHFLSQQQDIQKSLTTDLSFKYQVFQICNNIGTKTYDAADLFLELIPNKLIQQSQVLCNLISKEYTPYFFLGFETFDVDKNAYGEPDYGHADDYAFFKSKREGEWRTVWKTITHNKHSSVLTHVRNDSALPAIGKGHKSFTQHVQSFLEYEIQHAHLDVKTISNLHFVTYLLDCDKLAQELGFGIVDLKLAEAPFTSGFMQRNEDPLLLQWRYTEFNSKADSEIVLPYPPGYAWWFIGLEMLKVEHDHDTIEQSLAQSNRHTFRNDNALYSTPDNTINNEQELGVLTNTGLHVIMDAAARYDVYGVLTQTNMYTTMLFMWHTCVVHEMYRLLLSYLKMLCVVGYIELEESAEEAMAQLFRDCCTQYRYLHPGTESWRDFAHHSQWSEWSSVEKAEDAQRHHSMNSTKQKLEDYISNIQVLPHSQKHLLYAKTILHCTSKLSQYLKQMPYLLMKSESDRPVNIPNYIDDAIVAKFENTMRHPAVSAMLQLCSGNNIRHDVYNSDFDHATAAKLLHVLGVTPKSNAEISSQFHELLRERSRRARLSQASLVKQMWTTQATWRPNNTTENTDNNQHQAFADKKTMFVSDMTSNYHLYSILGKQNIMQSIVLEKAENVRINEQLAAFTYIKSDFSFFMQIAKMHLWMLRASEYQDASELANSDWYDILPHTISSHQKIDVALNFLLMSKMVFCEWHEYGSRVLNSDRQATIYKTQQGSTTATTQQPAQNTGEHAKKAAEAEATRRAAEQQKDEQKKLQEAEEASANKEREQEARDAAEKQKEEQRKKDEEETAARRAAAQKEKDDDEVARSKKQKPNSTLKKQQTIEHYMDQKAANLIALCEEYKYSGECEDDNAQYYLGKIIRCFNDFLFDRPYRTDPLIVLLLETHNKHIFTSREKSQGKKWFEMVKSQAVEDELYVFAEYWRKVLYRCIDKDNNKWHKKYNNWEEMKEKCEVDDHWLREAWNFLGKDDTKGPWQGDIREFLTHNQRGQKINASVQENGPRAPTIENLYWS